MPDLRIYEWKRTSGQYVAILQSIDRFVPGSIREIAKRGPETILGGTILGTNDIEWYALAYDRQEFEFDEARDMARRKIEDLRAQQRAG